MSYSEKSIQIACDASIAVLALSNSEGTDLEFLPLKPIDVAKLRGGNCVPAGRDAISAQWESSNW